MAFINLSYAMRSVFACLVFLSGLSVTYGITGDTCSDPWIITSMPFSGAGSTCGFNNDANGGCEPYGLGNAPDVVYSFTPAQQMQVDISLCGSNYDTVLYVFEGSCAGSPIACNDDHSVPPCGLQSQIDSLLLQPGATYYIVVDGFNGSCGDYVLAVNRTPIPGDDCGNPLTIYSLPFSDTRNSCNFTSNAGGYCAADNGAPDVVYVFVPDHHMQVDISLCGSTYDTALYVFKDFCMGTPIACNNDDCGSQSQIETLLLKANTTYNIVVDGNDGACGNYNLSVTKVLPPGDGNTTPYQISTPQQLIAIGTDPDLMDKWFILANDINMQGYVFNKAVIAPDMNNVTDGYQGTAFTGIFDGNGHTISNLTINSGGLSSDNMGLFGFIDGGQVQNLGLGNVNITGGDGSNGVGGLAGDNRGNILNCHSTGAVEVGNTLFDVGGLVGLNYGSIQDCYSACTVTAGQTSAKNIGGLAGSNYDAAEIMNCNASGDVSGYENVGGLIGINMADVSSCHASGSVTGIGSYVGGLIGQNEDEVSNCHSEALLTSGYENVGGLLGYNGGDVSNCYSAGAVSGTNHVGGLVGINLLFVSNCSSSCTVSGTESVGGLVGLNFWGDITNCYSSGSVNGTNNVGGLVGFVQGDGIVVSNCYSIGPVSSAEGLAVGGLIGDCTYGGPIPNSYYLASAWPVDNGLGTPLDDPNMKIQSNFVVWDFVGEYVNGGEDFWQMPCGEGYPRLRFEAVATFGGKGTPEEPYEISTADQLAAIGSDADLLDKHYILTNDIDMSGCSFTNAVIAPDINASDEYFNGTPFTGVFDGNGHKIINMTITGGENNFIGLFGTIGWIDQEGIVKNLGLEGISVGGDYRVGGLAGHIRGEGSASNCYSTGTVSGNNLVGGLVGVNDAGSVTNCYSTGTVSGTYNVGGLVGCNSGGSVTNCYSTGSVTGTDYVGGLVGANMSGILSNCYSTVSVTGTDYVGGLVGQNYRGFVSNCYSTGTVSGYDAVGGLVGWNLECNVTNCYSIGTVSGVYQVGGLVGVGMDLAPNCYFLDAPGLDNGWGEPLTDEQMKLQSSFVNWDFAGETANGTEDIWSICQTTNYPRLTWQIPPWDYLCPDGCGFEDYSVLASAWQEWELEIDLTGDIFVNMEDLALFCEHWLEGR